MARRKDHTREELIQLSIQCGRDIVIENGPSALTARSVAQRMGYTAGTLYNLFENIEGLITAINIQTLDAFAESLAQSIRSCRKPETRIERIAAAYLQLQDEQPQLWKLLFATPLTKITDDYHQAIHRVFDPVVETLLPLSGNPDTARKDAKILWATLHGICHLRESEKLDVSENDSPKSLVQQFLKKFLQP